jgi:hypothetical protein
MGFSRQEDKGWGSDWNSGGKNPLLLLLAISSHEEILFLAAGRAMFMLHASRKRRVG